MTIDNFPPGHDGMIEIDGPKKCDGTTFSSDPSDELHIVGEVDTLDEPFPNEQLDVGGCCEEEGCTTPKDMCMHSAMQPSDYKPCKVHGMYTVPISFHLDCRLGVRPEAKKVYCFCLECVAQLISKHLDELEPMEEEDGVL